MNENPVFQTINLRKEFGPTIALKSVGLGLRQGKFTA